jgi:hypothetical protein
LKEHSQNRFL